MVGRPSWVVPGPSRVRIGRAHRAGVGSAILDDIGASGCDERIKLQGRVLVAGAGAHAAERVIGAALVCPSLREVIALIPVSIRFAPLGCASCRESGTEISHRDPEARARSRLARMRSLDHPATAGYNVVPPSVAILAPVMEPLSSDTDAQPTGAPAWSAGTTPLLGYSPCKPNTQLGTTPCWTVSATPRPPPPCRPSSISTSMNSLQSCPRGDTAVIDRREPRMFVRRRLQKMHRAALAPLDEHQGKMKRDNRKWQ